VNRACCEVTGRSTAALWPVRASARSAGTPTAPIPSYGSACERNVWSWLVGSMRAAAAETPASTCRMRSLRSRFRDHVDNHE
jgi:hypothetical protein